MSKELLERTRQRFSDDKYATSVTGVSIVDVEENYAECELVHDQRHYNAAGIIMGGAIFTLADFCFAVAANWKEFEYVSVSSSITYLNASRGTKLIAKSKCLKLGKKNCCFEIAISDDMEKEIAVVVINGYKTV
ncbi:MAG: PaaI family thioesterase [Bacteroidales bacterium]|nr:PaaI family thioesterase [Bacteroidales bacterium]